MTNSNSLRSIKGTYPADLPIMYTYQVLAKIMEVGKAEPEMREVKLVDTNPESAVKRAQEQVTILDKPGLMVEWFVNFAGELMPEESMKFYQVHVNNGMDS